MYSTRPATSLWPCSALSLKDLGGYPIYVIRSSPINGVLCPREAGNALSFNLDNALFIAIRVSAWPAGCLAL